MNNQLFKIIGTTLDCYCGPEDVSRIEVPAGITKVANYAFEGLESLCSITLPETLQHIGDRAFHSCIELEYVQLPASLLSIGVSAFEDTVKLRSIDLPSGLIHLGEYSFCNSGLTHIVIPGSVRQICEGAFSYCDQLENVWIQDGVRECSAAFYGCSRLTMVSIPNSMAKMFHTQNQELNNLNAYTLDVFDFCPNLQDIRYNPS